MTRPAAEIEPLRWIVSSNWILPGPIRPPASISMRTLSEGSDLPFGFCMEDVLTRFGDHALRLKPFTNKLKRLHIRINTGFWNRHELSIAVFAAQDRPLPAPAPCRASAVDADAGGEAEPRAAAAERRILRAACNAGRIADC